MEYFPIPDFSGGNNLLNDAKRIAENQTLRTKNLVPYAKGILEKRKGSALYLDVGDSVTKVNELEVFKIGSDKYVLAAGNRTAADKTWVFEGLISARTDTDTSAAYKIQGCIKRDGANNTTIVGTPTITVIAEEDATWDVTVTADDTNEALRIGVWGIAGTYVRWVASVNLTEVAY